MKRKSNSKSQSLRIQITYRKYRHLITLIISKLLSTNLVLKYINIIYKRGCRQELTFSRSHTPSLAYTSEVTTDRISSLLDAQAIMQVPAKEGVLFGSGIEFRKAPGGCDCQCLVWVGDVWERVVVGLGLGLEGGFGYLNEEAWGGEGREEEKGGMLGNKDVQQTMISSITLGDRDGYP